MFERQQGSGIYRFLFCSCVDNFVLPGNNGLHQQYNVEDLHNNRMAVIANMVNQGGVPPGLGSDSTAAAANIAAANIASLMRLGVTQVCDSWKLSIELVRLIGFLILRFLLSLAVIMLKKLIYFITMSYRDHWYNYVYII